eukprot:763737-Prymnesium_polylepis.2
MRRQPALLQPALLLTVAGRWEGVDRVVGDMRDLHVAMLELMLALVLVLAMLVLARARARNARARNARARNAVAADRAGVRDGARADLRAGARAR